MRNFAWLCAMAAAILAGITALTIDLLTKEDL